MQAMKCFMVCGLMDLFTVQKMDIDYCHINEKRNRQVSEAVFDKNDFWFQLEFVYCCLFGGKEGFLCLCRNYLINF